MNRIDEINAMSFADLDQYLSTIPPLKCAAEIASPIADKHLCGPTFIDQEVAEDAYFDKAYEWDQVAKEGVFDVVGHAPIQYVAECVENIALQNKLVVLIGENNDIEEMLADDCHRFNFEFAHDLSDQEFAVELAGEISTQPIAAVVLIDQDDRLQHLDRITHVAVFRGNKISFIKKIPVYHIHTEQWEWVGERLMLRKEVFEPVEKAVVQQESERVGCLEKASDIGVEHREWLWPGYIGRNKVTHAGGASTVGKSPVTLDIIARITSGSDWPDGTKNTLGPKSAILLAAEDDWKDTINPRLKVAGANLDKVYRFAVKHKTVEITPSLDSDCQRLEQQIALIGDVVMVVIDPITNYLGSKQMNHEAEIRGGILMPLAAVAKNQQVAVITVGHLNKRGSEATVLQRLMGCAAFSGVARDVFIFGDDPDDEDKYSHTMTEIRNKSAPQLRYKTEMVKVEWDNKTSEVLRVRWCGVSHADVDDVVNPAKQQEKSITGRAVALITGMLRSGAKKKADIDQALKENGIPPEKLQFDRIRKRCKADTRPIPGKGAGWEWFLTTPKQEEFDK